MGSTWAHHICICSSTKHCVRLNACNIVYARQKVLSQFSTLQKAELHHLHNRGMSDPGNCCLCIVAMIQCLRLLAPLCPAIFGCLSCGHAVATSVRVAKRQTHWGRVQQVPFDTLDLFGRFLHAQELDVPSRHRNHLCPSRIFAKLLDDCTPLIQPQL